MKVYILTCINEEGTLTGAEVFENEFKARTAMRESMENEKFDAEESGYEIDDENIEVYSAYIEFGSQSYKWDITPTEVK
jgi:hypothetical protein